MEITSNKCIYQRIHQSFEVKFLNDNPNKNSRASTVDVVHYKYLLCILLHI